MPLKLIHNHPSGLPAIELHGNIHLLGRLPTPTTRRMAFPSFLATNPIIPRADWKPIDRRSSMGTSFLLNQKSHGSCVGFNSVGALARARALAGQTFVRLSGAYCYSKINGGSDNGANIGDSLDALQQFGTCTDAEAPWDAIYPKRYPATANATALRFRIDEGYRADSFDEYGTGLQLGYIGVMPVMVGSTFDNLDAEGVAGVDRGGGNHCIHTDGMKLSTKWGWLLDNPNSWSDPAGPYWGDQGRFFESEKHWDGLDMDAYLIRVSVWDPLDPNQPPKVAA